MEQEKDVRPSRQEIQERKINLAKERGSRVLLINSQLGSIMCNILRQFDMAYANFKGRMGEMGGVSFEEGLALIDEGRDIVLRFSDFTDRLSGKINFRYYTPHEIEEYLQWLEAQKNEGKMARNLDGSVEERG